MLTNPFKCGRVYRCENILTERCRLRLLFSYGQLQNFIGRCRIMRVGVTLACSECKRRNYTTNKNKKNNPDRIELNKYCPFCKKHTLHKETK